MAGWSGRYDIVFKGADEDFKEFNQAIAEKLKSLKKARVLKSGWASETWDWLEEYNPKTHLICAYETPLSEIYELEKYMGELMEQFPNIGVSGEVEMFCLSSGEGPWIYRMCSECGSTGFSLWLVDDEI